MTTAANDFQCAYIRASESELHIRYGKRSCHIERHKIRKMFIRRKVNYWQNLMHQLLLAPDRSYKFHIATEDGEIVFPVKSFERSHFIGLMSWWRQQSAKKAN
jgi:hypothetical protein